MSFEEPKAPIVRIRKKRTKKKSKDNDIVHLPVRASQQARYSSLTTPPNPQTKGRECCRVFFAGCMKIPVCRMVCFRCILPKCYSGEGSDDEDANVKDEGYHSQNRRSSEITPNPEPGAQGGAEPQTVEMTEIKSETVTLIPPPRTNINEYRRDPCKSEATSDINESEVTYIEVESVSLTGCDAAINIPDDDSKVKLKEFKLKEFKSEALEVGYEEPVQAGVLEFPILNIPDKEASSEYVDCDLSDDSESKIYVNESVLGIGTNSDEKRSSGVGKNYINVGPSDSDGNVVHSTTNIVKPHDYVNLKPVEAGDENASDNQSKDGVQTSLEKVEEKTEGYKSESKKQMPKNKSNDETQNKSDTGATSISKLSSLETNGKDEPEKSFERNNYDGEKLLIPTKKKGVESDSDSLDDPEEHSDNSDGDQTKLL